MAARSEVTNVPEDRDEEQQETYRKVDKRIGHQEEETAEEEPRSSAGPPAENVTAPDAAAEETEAPMPDEEALPEEALQIDMYGILRMMFGMCVEQAWVHLGLQLAPGAKETKTDLPQARLAIDTVAYIQQALGESLSAAERREVEQTLTTLRMNFVQRS